MKRIIPFVALAVLLYRYLIRPRYLSWGANLDETMREFPLDDRVPDATVVSTRAITIDAPPEQVWPWIVQMGDEPRAGYYSYAWIERMQGMQIENADEILPEYQSVAPGDALDRKGNIVVQHVDPPHALVVGPPEGTPGIDCTWAFTLEPEGTGTRLATRVRAKVEYIPMLRAARPHAWPFLVLLEPGAFVMERKMLLEIKRRAESSDAAAAGVLSGGGTSPATA